MTSQAPNDYMNTTGSAWMRKKNKTKKVNEDHARKKKASSPSFPFFILTPDAPIPERRMWISRAVALTLRQADSILEHEPGPDASFLPDVAST